MDGKWDFDIAALELSDEEKNGLQVYRNYSNSFSEAREKQFAKGVDHAPPNTDQLSEVLSLIAKDEIRFVPVVACAFADEALEAMFRMFLPDGLPGGKKALLARFGPLSTLFNRIQLAYAFDMIHSDILLALDRLREQRNKVSHTWNSAVLVDFFKHPLPQMEGLEEALASFDVAVDLDTKPESAFRVRTMWIVARLFYETRFYPLAKLARVAPLRALYGPNHPQCLGKITNCALTFTRSVTAEGP